MNIDQAEDFANKTLVDPEVQDKKDNLDFYRHIIIWLAKDILADVKQYRQYSKPWQFKIRSGILKQINIWTLVQINDNYHEMREKIQQGMFDKPSP